MLARADNSSRCDRRLARRRSTSTDLQIDSAPASVDCRCVQRRSTLQCHECADGSMNRTRCDSVGAVRRVAVGRSHFAWRRCAASGAARRRRPPLPKSPVTINVVDVAGNLALTQEAIEAYRRPRTRSSCRKVTFTKAPAPELPGKIKAQQERRPRRHRPRADRHRRAVRRHRAGAVGASSCPITPRSFPTCWTTICRRRAKMQELAQDQALVRHVHARRPAARIHAGQGEDSRRRRRRSCSPGQGQSRTASSMRARPIPAPAAPS